MSTKRSFKVFGEPVEILVAGHETGGRVTVLIQTSPPGGGPPPHLHTREDEVFTVLEGEFEMFDGTTWHPLKAGQSFFGPKCSPHTFRNAGSTAGKIHVVAFPAGMDDYLELIRELSMPGDFPKLISISEKFGITFL